MFHVWTKRQVLTVLAGVLLLTALTSAGAAALLMRPQAEEEAVAVFQESGMLFSLEAVETPGPDPAPTPSALPTAEATPAMADRAFRIEVVRQTPAPQQKEKRILIYHTHTWEAFTQVADAPYVETEKWRTKDNQYNVVAVGEALANQLRALGFTVIHDTTAFEPPNLDSSYARSLAMLEERDRLGESYDLYIDLHRDAISSSSTIKRTVNIGGTEVARFMVLIGKGTGAGFDVKPDWEANLVIGEKLTACLNDQADSLCRDIKLRTGRYNQHIAPRCVLIECGNNLNTLEQVLNGVPYLANAIAETLEAMAEPTL